MEETNPYVYPGVPSIMPEHLDKHLEQRVTHSGIPEHMFEGIIAYLRYGRPAGSFLEAIISNDAAEAVRRADQENLAAIGAWFVLLINAAPSGAWGSEENYTRWLAMGREARKRAAEVAGS